MMPFPPAQPVSKQTWLDQRRARRRRGRRALEGAAVFVTVAAVLVSTCPLAAVLVGLLAAYCAFVAIDAGLPWDR